MGRRFVSAIERSMPRSVPFDVPNSDDGVENYARPNGPG
jgi:hypothetical protein